MGEKTNEVQYQQLIYVTPVMKMIIIKHATHYQQSKIAILSSSELKKAVLLRFHI